MILLNKITLNKKIVPAYVFNFYLAFSIFLGVWFLAALPVVITVGILYDEDPVTYITMGCVFGAFIIGILIFLPIGLKLRERLINEYAAKLETEYADMSLDKATQILKERGVITDEGFICEESIFEGNNVIPFDRLKYLFYAVAYEVKQGGGHVKIKPRYNKIDIYLQVYDVNEEGDVEAESTYDVDGALFNFLDKKELIKDYETDKDFALLKCDKKNFCRSVFGFRLK